MQSFFACFYKGTTIMTNRIQPVAFHDVNGNLIDDEPLHQEKLIATTRRYGISLREEDFHQEHHFPIRGKNGVMFLPEKPMKLHGAGDETLYWWAVAQRKELQDILSIQDWNKELFAYYIEHAQEVKPRENMVELIEKLAADKVLQAIVTSGVPQQVEANMAVLGNAAKHMEFIMGAHDVIYRKPAPECYIVAGYRMQKIIDARYGGAKCTASLRRTVNLVCEPPSEPTSIVSNTFCRDMRQHP